MITRDEITRTARTYLGSKWKHRGRNRIGVDCVGLILCIARDLGIEAQDVDREYKRTPEIELFLDQLKRQTVAGSVRNIRPGSILVLNQGPYPCHCGIVTPGPQPLVLHASVAKRCVVEEHIERHFSTIREVREYPGVA